MPDPYVRHATAEDEESLGRLDPRTRLVLLLRFWSDLTVPQIARRLALPLGTVKSSIHRGLTALRATSI